LPVRGYNADALEAHYDRRPLAVGWRLNALGFPLLGWYGRLLIDQALGRSSDTAVQHAQGVALRQALVQSGSVALIKSGQALSLRPDLLRNPIWADELGKLVDAVGAFDDREALQILSRQLADIKPRLKGVPKRQRSKRRTKLQALAEDDDILSLFEFSNNHQAIASASIGQVYKARIRRGPALEAAIGKEAAQIWGGKTVAIKIQRPDARTSASLDMYLLRRTAMWLSKVRAGDLVPIADAFGRQLFGELDYVREANNCERFGQLYREWPDVCVPAACEALTRRKVLVMEWVDGTKGPWQGPEGIEMVRIGLRCSVDQLMTTGLFHADPHRGNLLQTSDNKLAFLDFGMMADIDEDDRYGLFGLVIGLQNKDLPLVTEYLLKVGALVRLWSSSCRGLANFVILEAVCLALKLGMSQVFPHLLPDCTIPL
jgi:predicted unusual protein kinase regulating ubiquinone biosynthesis (AarF/ABC1/UbiB family)